MFMGSIWAGVALATTFLVLACGGSSTNVEEAPLATPTPDFRTVTSDDGKLTLEIPLGAVGEDVEITISRVSFDELPAELQVVRGAGDGYLLEPAGLVFSEPVAVTLELSRGELVGEQEGMITAYALVTLSADKVRTVLEGQATEWTRGEDTVTVRGQLRHFSWITRTQASMTVDLEQAPREQLVGRSFSVRAAAGNTDQTSQVTLSGVIGSYFTIGGVLSIDQGETSISAASLAPDEWERGTAMFKCDLPGVALYGVRVLALSLVEGSPEGTQLELTVDSDVDCVAGAPTPTPDPGAPTTVLPPEASPTSPSTSTASLEIGCEHTNPGVSSELLVRVTFLDPDEPVSGEVRGDGLASSPEAIFGNADSDGVAFWQVTIFDFGPYSVGFDVLELSSVFEVGDVCLGLPELD